LASCFVPVTDICLLEDSTCRVNVYYRCVETDTEVQRCLSALRRATDVVPDTRKCRRASDAFVPAHSVDAQTTEPIQDVSQPDESAQNTTTIKKSESFPSQNNTSANFDVRDYLIDRCVTDTNPAAAAVTDTDEADNSDEIDGVDKPDETELLRRLRDPSERSSKPPPPTLPSQRFSDTDLVRGSCPPAVAATLPGLASSTSSAADSRAKRHRWKLLRKALNLLLVDESTPTVTVADAGNAVGDEDRAAQGEEESHRLGVFSVSVESLPGSVDQFFFRFLASSVSLFPSLSLSSSLSLSVKSCTYVCMHVLGVG